MTAGDQFVSALRRTLQAVQVGPVAARALREGAQGTVRAVFERSFYLALDDVWICVGPPGLGAGPFNLLCVAPPDGWTPATHVALSDAARVVSGWLYVGDALSISHAGAAQWRPASPSAFEPDVLGRGLASFSASLPAELPAEGFARLLISPAAREDDTPALAAARAPAHYLSRLVSGTEGAARVEPGRLAPLLGLGPGLTPSGDDFLGGAMVALAMTGRHALRDAIWNAIVVQVPVRTNEISGAHLSAAVEGFGSAALHDLLDDVIAARSAGLGGRIDAVAAIGHTSGWDALAGAIVVLDALARGGR